MSAVNIADLRLAARARLPKAIFEFVDGGALDEVTLRANRSAFERIAFLPRMCADVSNCSLSTTVLGQTLQLPIIMAPIGLCGIVRRRAELIAAQMTSRFGAGFCLSMMAAANIQEVAAAASTPPWFQLYMLKDRSINRLLLERARTAGCKVLVLTLDTKTQGPRERDVRNGFTVPPRITLSNVLDVVRRLGWVRDVALGPQVTYANLAGLLQSNNDVFTITQFIADKYDSAFDWEVVEWCKSEWRGPVAVKGIFRADEAKQAVQHGADGIIVSNHGGRQLDGAIASIDALPAIVDAIGSSADVILDSGVRRGVDVVKALALGAKACMAGRPFVYALAGGGERGMHSALEIFRNEIEKTLMLLGCNSVQALNQDLLRVN